MYKQKSNILAVLDISSTKIVCMIAKTAVNDLGMEVIGIGHNVAHGVKAGIIIDIDVVEKSVRQALDAAQKMAGIKIQSLYVNIAANNFISQRVNSEINVTGHEISEKTINKLLFDALDRYQDQDLEIIHSFACDYILDGHRGIQSPLGMFGNKLMCNYHMILTSASALLNIANCVARCRVDVENYIASSYSAGLACLSEEERNLGVMLINMNGGTTSISIFSNGQMTYSEGIPLGGISVTNDIAQGLYTDFDTAERIKTLYGNTFAGDNLKNDIIEINTFDNDLVSIKKSLLIEIIGARVEEILEILIKKLENNTIINHGARIVITGGACQIPGVKELVEQMFDKPARVGIPRDIPGLAENTRGISFVTPIGMLLYVKQAENLNKKLFGEDRGIIGNIIKWFKTI